MKQGKDAVRNKLFIKDIENISGIKAHTIRIWEQRYNIINPKRTDTGIRYYDDEDLRFILNISILNNNGYKISKIAKMGMDCHVRLQRPDSESNDIHIVVSGPDAGRIIGKKGQVLAALQFIVNRAMNRPGIERRYVSVDADGYRSRREDSLASMARRLGKQAVSDGQIITFEPMSPRDRRVVHLALAKFEGVVTKSEGEGDDRRVQIIPVRRG